MVRYETGIFSLLFEFIGIVSFWIIFLVFAFFLIVNPYGGTFGPDGFLVLPVFGILCLIISFLVLNPNLRFFHSAEINDLLILRNIITLRTVRIPFEIIKSIEKKDYPLIFFSEGLPFFGSMSLIEIKFDGKLEKINWKLGDEKYLEFEKVLYAKMKH
jgi:hypothetical protein